MIPYVNQESESNQIFVMKYTKKAQRWVLLSLRAWNQISVVNPCTQSALTLQPTSEKPRPWKTWTLKSLDSK